MIGLDNTILNVTLPTLQAALSATLRRAAVDRRRLPAGLRRAAAGRRQPRRPVGTPPRAAGRHRSSSASAPLLAALSTTAAALIASRAVMGVGAALIMPSTLSIITNIFTGPRAGQGHRGLDRGRRPGHRARPGHRRVAAGALLVGLDLPGQRAHRRPHPARRRVPGPRVPRPRRRPPDPLGVLLSIGGLLALVYGVIEAPTRAGPPPVTLAAFATAVGPARRFVAWELHTDHPMLQLRLFRNRRFSAASAAIALAFFALFGACSSSPSTCSWSSATPRCRPAPAPYPSRPASSPAPRLSAPLTPGSAPKSPSPPACCSPPAAWPCSPAPPPAAATRRCWPHCCWRTGIGVAMAPATDSVMGALPLAKASVGSAMNDTARLVGGAFGVAVLGTTISQVYRDHIADTAAQLPAAAAAPASDSLQAALQVAAHLPGPNGDALATAAQVAFTDAMNRAALVGAVMAAGRGHRRAGSPASPPRPALTRVSSGSAAHRLPRRRAGTDRRGGRPGSATIRPGSAGPAPAGPARPRCGRSALAPWPAIPQARR